MRFACAVRHEYGPVCLVVLLNAPPPSPAYLLSSCATCLHGRRRYRGAETWELFNDTDLGCDKEKCTGVRGYRDLVKAGVLQGGRDFFAAATLFSG